MKPTTPKQHLEVVFNKKRPRVTLERMNWSNEVLCSGIMLRNPVEEVSVTSSEAPIVNAISRGTQTPVNKVKTWQTVQILCIV